MAEGIPNFTRTRGTARRSAFRSNASPTAKNCGLLGPQSATRAREYGLSFTVPGRDPPRPRWAIPAPGHARRSGAGTRATEASRRHADTDLLGGLAQPLQEGVRRRLFVEMEQLVVRLDGPSNSWAEELGVIVLLEIGHEQLG